MVKHHFAILEYARCMEKQHGVTVVHTSNLHTAICRLLVQCTTRGHCGTEGELWIERVVQVLTRSIVQSRANPEHTMALRLAYDDATIKIARGVPEAVDLTEDLPVFCRDKQEQHYVQ